MSTWLSVVAVALAALRGAAHAQAAPVTLMTRDPSRDWAGSTREREPPMSPTKKKLAATGTGGAGAAKTGAAPPSASPSPNPYQSAGAKPNLSVTPSRSQNQSQSQSQNPSQSQKPGPVPNQNPSQIQAQKPGPVPIASPAAKPVPNAAFAATPAPKPQPNAMLASNQPVKPMPNTAFATTLAPPQAPAGNPAQSPAPAQAAPPQKGRVGMQVIGLKGTLNKIDVQQAMEARSGDLDVCIQRSRRSLRLISGAMRFGCKVDPDGHILDMRILSTDLGHRELERCVSDIVATTEFKKPSGHAVADFAWGMSVEPAPGTKAPDAGSYKLVAKVVSKHAREAFETCEVKRGKVRLRVTAYVSTDGRILSVGAVPSPPRAEPEKVDCLLGELKKWRVGKPKHPSKISFNLR